MKIIFKNSKMVFAKKDVTALAPTQRIDRTFLVSNGTITGGVSTFLNIDVYQLTAGVTYKISSASNWAKSQTLNTTLCMGAASTLQTSGSIAPYTKIAEYNTSTADPFTEYFTPEENCYLYVSTFDGSGVFLFDIVY